MVAVTGSTPIEDAAEGKVLNNRKLSKHLCVVHLQHSLEEKKTSRISKREINRK